MEILLALGIPSIVVSIWIAVSQNRKARQTQAQLDLVLSSLPDQVGRTVKAIVEAGPRRESDQLRDPEWPSTVDYVDVDHDGKRELLVQYLAGAHGNALQIFGWRNHEFKEIATLGVGTPTPFEFADFDGDGKIEIRGIETDWSTDLPYVIAPRIEIFYRWDGKQFNEVWRKRTYADDELRIQLKQARDEGIVTANFVINTTKHHLRSPINFFRGVLRLFATRSTSER